MASEPNISTAVESSGPIPPSPLRAIARNLFAPIRRNPLPSLLVLLATLVTLAAVGWGLRVINHQEKTEPPLPTLANALAELDEGNREAARNIAADLRMRDDLPVEKLGGPPYVLGVAIALDAADHWSQLERRSLHLLASRYLEEALETGLHADRRGHAQFLLGKSLYGYGRFAESLPILHLALKSYPQQSTDIHRLLAGAYLQDSNPQLQQALQFNRLYLTDQDLDEEQREDAHLTQAQILFRLDDITSCSETLEHFTEDSKRFPAALLIKGQILLQQGDLAQDVPATTAEQVTAEAKEKYTAAIEEFREAQRRASANHELVGKSRYLLGVAYRKLADFTAAETQFNRTRRSHFETQEGLAAGFQEAEVQREQLNKHEEAISSYRNVLRQAADMKVYSNPWISLDELRDRTQRAYQEYFDNEDYDRAIELANVFSPLFATDYAIQLQAEAQQALAEHLTLEAQPLPTSEAVPILEKAHAAWRKAGAFYSQLGGQRFSTREYPEALWQSANAYLRGHDYRRAVRLLKAFLKHETRRNHPAALTALGQAQLALGQPGLALKSLQECIEFFAKDPHSYRARLIAAQAYAELGALPRSKDLLTGNLDHESLRPNSIEWRESLYALGKIHYREGLQFETRSRLEGVNREDPDQRKAALKLLESAHEAFHRAIERLSEAVQRDALNNRDPFLSETLEARYLIAEAHRQSAKLPLKRLATVSIETTQNKLNSEIQQELNAAELEYQQLQDRLNQKQEATLLSETENRILRNCYFARADVLYDLKRFEEAIQAYSNATNRYQHEPESLEAYVQIANCHRQLNRDSEARGTLEQAKVVLQRIRADADFISTTRYDRKQWGELLDWLTTL